MPRSSSVWRPRPIATKASLPAADRVERTQERLERALADLRQETEARARAEPNALTAENRVEKLKVEVAGLRGETEPRKSRKRTS